MKRLLLLAAALVAVLVALPVTFSSGHPERPTTFPNPSIGHVPAFRSSGPSIVVCKSDSGKRLKREFAPRRYHRALGLRLVQLKRCKYRDIQAAINHAKSNYRILVMPGVYKEIPSRRIPITPKKCSDQNRYFAVTEGYDNVNARSNDPPVRANFRFQHDCPNARNLIAVIGNKHVTADTNPSPAPPCDRLCNLQITGMGLRPGNVQIVGDRKKMDVIRVDRASGFAIRNVLVQEGAFNGIDGVQINGFHFKDIIARFNQNYGILTFTAEHGLYERIRAYGNGDSGVYPGSSPKGCSPANGYGNRRYGIELRKINSYGNTLGYSGTAGNSTWIHDSQFHDNSTGLSTDSFASGHPGMPQECAKWENNRFNSNNLGIFNSANQKYCGNTPFAQRKPLTRVCPQFQVPEGSGIIIYGGNRNLIRNNRIYDNWKSGIRLFGIPAAIRGENDPSKQQDTSNGNQILNNSFGRTASGRRAPNGHDPLVMHTGDITWDDEGQNNCQQGNSSADGPVTFSDGVMPGCPGRPIKAFANGALGRDAPCAAWDPKTMPRPPGCDWFDVPSRPK